MISRKIRDRSMEVKKRSIVWSIIWSIIFVIYIIYVMYIVYYSRHGYYMGGVNLRLFSSYIEAFHNSGIHVWFGLIANILLFVPFGFLLPHNLRLFRKFWLSCSAGIVFSLLIEIIQYVTKHGIFDIDDIFNNIIGTIIGYSLFKLGVLVTNTIKHHLKKTGPLRHKTVSRS
jgi:glycopeptide antibiotics resistance protein